MLGHMQQVHTLREQATTILTIDTRTCFRSARTPPRRHYLAVAASAHSGNAEIEQLKADLIRATANTKRGKAASPQQQEAVLEKAAALEALNPTQNPASSPLLNGRWSLLYQGPEEVKDISEAESLEGPLLSFFKPVVGFLFRTLGITQIIDTENGKIQNLAEFKFAAVLRGSLNILGTVKPAAPNPANRSLTRVDVAFTAFRVQLGLLAFSVPIGWANPNGWVETTFVDETLRIGHGDKGSIFVTARQQQRGR